MIENKSTENTFLCWLENSKKIKTKINGFDVLIVGAWNNHKYGREKQDALHPDGDQHRGEDETEPEAEPGGAGPRRRVGDCGRGLHLALLNCIQPENYACQSSWLKNLNTQLTHNLLQ